MTLTNDEKQFLPYKSVQAEYSPVEAGDDGVHDALWPLIAVVSTACGDGDGACLRQLLAHQCLTPGGQSGNVVHSRVVKEISPHTYRDDLQPAAQAEMLAGVVGAGPVEADCTVSAVEQQACSTCSGTRQAQVVKCQASGPAYLDALLHQPLFHPLQCDVGCDIGAHARADGIVA